MRYCIINPAKKVKANPIIFIICLLGFLSLPMSCIAETKNTSAAGALHLAAALVDNEDDEEDEEEEAVDYRDRVREIQRWMNRRDTERKGLITPTLNAVQPPTQFPKYFRDNGFDVNGYRKLEPELRVRLRDAPEAAPSENPANSDDHESTSHNHRHHSWNTRWQRHVHPNIRWHSRQGSHHSSSRQAYSNRVSSHHHGHTQSKHYSTTIRPKPNDRHSKATFKPTKKTRSRH